MGLFGLGVGWGVWGILVFWFCGYYGVSESTRTCGHWNRELRLGF